MPSTATATNANIKQFDTKVLSTANAVIKFPEPLETPYIEIDNIKIDLNANDTQNPEWLSKATQLLRQNEAIAIPTETVYGLAANALSSTAVKKIFAAKCRPADNPLIVHVSSIEMIQELYHLPSVEASEEQQPFLGIKKTDSNEWPEIPKVYHELIKSSWPGALTIVLPRPPCIPLEVLGGHGTTVAFRFPSHPVARAIIAASGLPLAAPSANASGRPSPTIADHVLYDMNGRIPLIVDGGQCDVGLESTVVDAISPNQVDENEEVIPLVLRPGGIVVEELVKLGGVWKNVKVYRRDFINKQLETLPTTPGMKYKHYSPNAAVTLFIPPTLTDCTSLDERSSRMTEQIYKQYLSLVDASESNVNSNELFSIGIIATSSTIQALNELIPSDSESNNSTLKILYRQVASVADLAHQMFLYMRERLDKLLELQSSLLKVSQTKKPV